jgi:hypothetical protein
VELVERRELRDGQRPVFRGDGCERRLDAVGEAGGAIVLAHHACGFVHVFSRMKR